MQSGCNTFLYQHLQGCLEPQRDEQEQHQQQVARRLAALAQDSGRLQLRLELLEASRAADLQQLQRRLQQCRRRVQREYEQQMRAFEQEWGERLNRLPSSGDPFWWCLADRSRESVLAERDYFAAARDRELAAAQLRHDAGRRACEQRWEQEAVPLMQELQGLVEQAAAATAAAAALP
jgi:hypothetical protein